MFVCATHMKASKMKSDTKLVLCWQAYLYYLNQKFNISIVKTSVIADNALKSHSK